MVLVKLYKIILVLVLFFQIMDGHAQNNHQTNQKMSSTYLRDKDDPDADAIKKRLLYAKSIFNDSISVALSIIESNLLIAIEKNYKKEQALAYSILGEFNEELSNNPLALSDYKKSVTLYTELGNHKELTKLYVCMGRLETRLGNDRNAITYFESAVVSAIKTDNSKEEVNAKIELGELHLKQNDPKKANAYYKDAYQRAVNTHYTVGIIRSEIGLGKVAERNGDLETSEAHYSKAQQLAEENKLDNLSNEAFALLSNFYISQNDATNGIQIQQQAYNYNLDRNNYNSLLNTTTDMAKTYSDQGNNEEALKILNANSIYLDEEDNTAEKRAFIKTLWDTYEEEGLDEQATEQAKKYQELLDSFNYSEDQKQLLLASKNEFVENTQNKMLLLEKDRELNEKTIQLLKKEQDINNETIKRQRTVTYSLGIGLLVIGIMAFLLYRNSRQKQIANQLLVLKSLRNQMNPHFIFNSLNSVNGFISKKDEKSANKYLAEFSKLMREVLENSQQDFIPLSKEVEILRLYLQLEHFRFSNEFDYTFEIDPAIRLDDYQIPPMLLQPFIENAIWHGLRYKQEKGFLKVVFSKKDNHIEIEITDNGIGREKSKEMKTLNQKKMESTGIKNVENRLGIINDVFKKDLQISIADLDETTKEGTIVKLKLY